MARKETRRPFSFVILDEREAAVVTKQTPDLLDGFVHMVQGVGLIMQAWRLEPDEIVCTIAKRSRLTAQDVASRVNCDVGDLEEMLTRNERPMNSKQLHDWAVEQVAKALGGRAVKHRPRSNQ